MVEWAHEIAPGTLKHSTLTYHFRKAAAAAYVVAPQRRRFDGARRRITTQNGRRIRKQRYRCRTRRIRVDARTSI
jgi:hypothetical protein